MNKSILVLTKINELLSDLGRIPEPVFAFVDTKNKDFSSKIKNVLSRRRRARHKRK